jgi:hypothetical protein
MGKNELLDNHRLFTADEMPRLKEIVARRKPVQSETIFLFDESHNCAYDMNLIFQPVLQELRPYDPSVGLECLNKKHGNRRIFLIVKEEEVITFALNSPVRKHVVKINHTRDCNCFYVARNLSRGDGTGTFQIYVPRSF